MRRQYSGPFGVFGVAWRSRLATKNGRFVFTRPFRNPFYIAPTKILSLQSTTSDLRIMWLVGQVKGRQTGGFQTGGFPDLDLSFFFCPFWDFPDFSVRGFSRLVLFLFLGLLRAPTRNSPERVRDTIWTFPGKSGKHPGLETPRFSFSQSEMCHQAVSVVSQPVVKSHLNNFFIGG